MRKLLWAVLIVLCAAPPAAFLFAWSGLYNVAASNGHLPIVSWLLKFGMENSIETYSTGVDPPPLTDAALVERGILYFQSGCAPCHGAPGLSRSPVALQMLPPPPELTDAVHHWSTAELFRIVKHGIKYTGMPAWPAPGRDDEVWALVAFLTRMPQIPPAEYKTATRRHDSGGDAARAIAHEGLIVGPFACASCHGATGQGSPLGSVPRLAGQKAAYLEMALEDFATTARPSGMMAPPAVNLDQQQRSDLARYYSSLKPEKADEPGEGSGELQRRGAILVEQGDPSRGIPACQACHGKDGLARDNVPQYPALAGQHLDYLANQLRLFRANKRGGRLAEVMSATVRNLTDDDIEAVASYYSRLK
ncbi:c-type cytochrome [Bradyrhizobium sp. LHD-71]|uniref:c-type cytochrome n=1 Tax=Bradyrhizobium sp. LHD-71 TaxID=3072141 RepID=UPI00280F074D|nr:c-type cytochrome [Bradyrhizobium sp. LHD-71]MDQ8732168.1 c-type cytochrome [Bradyrhizobium sp. LHD-71]